MRWNAGASPRVIASRTSASSSLRCSGRIPCVGIGAPYFTSIVPEWTPSERSALELAHLARRAARSFREDDPVEAAADAFGRSRQAPYRALAIAAIDHDLIGEAERPAEERDPPELALRDEAPRAGKRQDQRPHVEHALVVRHEHVRSRPIDVLQTLGFDGMPQARKIHDSHVLPIHTIASPLNGATSIAGAPQNTV